MALAMDGMQMDSPSSMEAGMSMGGSMAGVSSWTLAYTGWMFWMWVVMMIGMTVPTATPTTLVYAGVARKAGCRTVRTRFAPTLRARVAAIANVTAR